MIQKVENILISIFGWIIGPMVTAILAITVMNYKATVEGNNLINSHMVSSSYEKQYMVRRLYEDSIQIIQLNEYINKIHLIVQQAHPELFEQVMNDNSSLTLNKLEAILPKKKNTGLI